MHEFDFYVFEKDARVLLGTDVAGLAADAARARAALVCDVYKFVRSGKADLGGARRVEPPFDSEQVGVELLGGDWYEVF